MQTETNIKNLPEGNYFTQRGYSQSYPWIEVKRTPKTVTLAKVNVTKDPEWEPIFHAGGFSAHCENQGEQTWLFDEIDYDHTITIKMSERGWGRGTFKEGMALEFYDYNF